MDDEMQVLGEDEWVYIGEGGFFNVLNIPSS